MHAVTYNEKKRPRESRETHISKPTPGSRKYPYRKEVFYHYKKVNEEIPYKLECTYHNKKCFTKDYDQNCKFKLSATKPMPTGYKKDKQMKSSDKSSKKEKKSTRSRDRLRNQVRLMLLELT